MMLMMGDDLSSMSDMLPLMMMGGGMGGAPGAPGAAGAMNPMMLMLLGDDEKSEAACSRKYKLDKAFLWDGTSKVLAKTTAADIRTTVKDIKKNFAKYGYTAVPSIITDYDKCITDAAGKVGDDSKKDSKMKDLLPLMMM